MDRFHLPCTLTKKEAAAIERRRRFEEERKTRIFNPKARIMGVDANVLQQQIAERKAREERERCRDLQFDQERIRYTVAAAEIEGKMDELRRKINKDINTYRMSYQQPETRREYDLYDPTGLRKEIPCRIDDEDPRCGPSSAQKFAGEDLRGKERMATQREQQRAWLEQQLAERQAAEDERKRAERALQKAVLAQDSHASSMQHVQNECKRRVQQATLQFNVALAAEQEARRKAQEAMDEEDKRMELYNLMTGDLLTENPEAAKSALGPHRLIPDRWKGMSAKQLEDIRQEQLRQAQEKKTLIELELKKQQDWENYMLRCDNQALQAEHDLEGKRRQLNEHTSQFNQLLGQRQQTQKDYTENVLYANEATKEYFDQFGTTTR